MMSRVIEWVRETIHPTPYVPEADPVLIAMEEKRQHDIVSTRRIHRRERRRNELEALYVNARPGPRSASRHADRPE
jgi:hypothetical protein